MKTLIQNPFFWTALIGVLLILPSVFGAIRNVGGLGWLVIPNLIPTGVGWLAAMVLAFMLPRREPHPASLQRRWHPYRQPQVRLINRHVASHPLGFAWKDCQSFAHRGPGPHRGVMVIAVRAGA
jgi:hypothetical protein